MNKATFKLACIIALLSISSLFGAQALPLDLAKEREIVALINQVTKQVTPLRKESEQSNRQWFNAQGESILILPTQYIQDKWQIPFDGGLQKFAGTPLEVIVPYVLRKMGALPRPTELFQRKISVGSRKQLENTELMIHEPSDKYWIYHQWSLKSDNTLTHNRWVDGERKTCDGKDYQCREGRIVCEDDVEALQGKSFQQYVDEVRRVKQMWRGFSWG